ncbi:hypothetical protein ACJRO7_002487 [Eucalyptus globulus]|uniref:Dirigent protein n=1 Tax=Eucalyptus globulus TaxID=34317 RepID=A0ABD3LYB9_EUCGL
MALTLTKFIVFSFLVSSTVLNAKSELLTSKREKLTRFHVYVQVKTAGSNATVAIVAQASTTNQSATSFRLMSSKNVGGVRGMEAFASQSEVALSTSQTFVFTKGKHNGRCLTFVGRNVLSLKVREMPIVGGTGLFRLARGYAQTSTYLSDLKNGLLVVVYDFYAYHY